jgi:hypothetical protein
VHDSILWIGDKQFPEWTELTVSEGTKGTKGTASEMMKILGEIGEAYNVKQNGCVKREYNSPSKMVFPDSKYLTKKNVNC